MHTASCPLENELFKSVYAKTPDYIKELNLIDFNEKGAVILGVSKDSVKSHKKFQEKYQLPFTLLSDPELQVIQAYDVWKEKGWVIPEIEETFNPNRTTLILYTKELNVSLTFSTNSFVSLKYIYITSTYINDTT